MACTWRSKDSLLGLVPSSTVGSWAETQAVRLGSKCFYLLNYVGGLRMSLLYKGLFFIILNYVSVCFCMWVVLGQKMLQTKLGSSAKAMLEPYG